MSMMFAPPAPRLYQPESFRKVLRDAELTGDETLADFVQATLDEQNARARRHGLPELAPYDPPKVDAVSLLKRMIEKVGCAAKK